MHSIMIQIFIQVHLMSLLLKSLQNFMVKENSYFLFNIIFSVGSKCKIELIDRIPYHRIFNESLNDKPPIELLYLLSNH